MLSASYLIVVADLLRVDDAGCLEFLQFLLQLLYERLELHFGVAVLLVMLPHYRVDVRLVLLQLWTFSL